MSEEIRMSTLPKTWVLDLDGTLVKHNGYKVDGRDTMLPGIERFLQQISSNDMIIIVTSRKENCRGQTTAFLKENGIRYDHIIFDAPYGERILVNDRKPSGLKTSFAFAPKRDEVCDVALCRDESL